MPAIREWQMNPVLIEAFACPLLSFQWRRAVLYCQDFKSSLKYGCTAGKVGFVFFNESLYWQKNLALDSKWLQIVQPQKIQPRAKCLMWEETHMFNPGSAGNSYSCFCQSLYVYDQKERAQIWGLQRRWPVKKKNWTLERNENLPNTYKQPKMFE